MHDVENMAISIFGTSYCPMVKFETLIWASYKKLTSDTLYRLKREKSPHISPTKFQDVDKFIIRSKWNCRKDIQLFSYCQKKFRKCQKLGGWDVENNREKASNTHAQSHSFMLKSKNWTFVKMPVKLWTQTTHICKIYIFFVLSSSIYVLKIDNLFWYGIVWYGMVWYGM